jgi:hypothetical protein
MIYAADPKNFASFTSAVDVTDSKERHVKISKRKYVNDWILS